MGLDVPEFGAPGYAADTTDMEPAMFDTRAHVSRALLGHDHFFSNFSAQTFLPSMIALYSSGALPPISLISSP